MKVFVDGNPETPAVWGLLLDALATAGVGDVVTLTPPGFGAPLPDGFGASANDYAEWLTAELAALHANDDVEVDLVGHDWGAGHVARVAADRQRTADRPPGLVVVAEQDTYVPADLGRAVADRLGADTVSLDAGPWWMTSHPAPAAAGLRRFWTGLDAG